jgi:hypothetical protein
MKITLLLVAALALPSPAGAADFEGVLESKLSGSVSGTMRTWVSSRGIRAENDIELPKEAQAAMGKRMRTVIIVRRDEPNVTYLLDEERKTFSAIADEPGDATDDEAYTAERVGKATVAGFACDRVKVRSGDGSEEFELCMAPALASDTWLRAFHAQGEDRGIEKALADAGVKGLPIRWSSKGDEPGETYVMELVSAKRQKVPPSTFAIPKGYTKTAAPSFGMPPEAAKAMEDAMKDLTPEERQELEKMLKGMGGER